VKKAFTYIFCLLVILTGCAGYHAKKADVHNKLGIEYVVKKDYDKAIDEFNEAIKLNNRKLEFYYNLGVTYTEKDHISKESEDAYLKAIEYAPEATEGERSQFLLYTHYNLACIYALRGDKDNAFDHLEKAIALGGNQVYHLMQRDTDMDSLKDSQRFKELFERIKERK